MIDINKNIKKQFEQYIEMCCELFNYDKNSFIDDCKFIENAEYKKSQDIFISKYVKEWYESLNNNSPKYELYNGYYYDIASWLSYKYWSRKYLKFIDSNKDTYFNNVNNIIDFGCGSGMSTLLLSTIFQDSTIVGTNIKDSNQIIVAKHICCHNKNIKIVSDYSLLESCDLAFCSEYFEHFENPIDHLNAIVKQCKPKIFCFANAFSTIAVGHFKEYIDSSSESYVSGKKISKLFNIFLKNNGYVKINHSGWNNRPNIYRLIES